MSPIEKVEGNDSFPVSIVLLSSSLKGVHSLQSRLSCISSILFIKECNGLLIVGADGEDDEDDDMSFLALSFVTTASIMIVFDFTDVFYSFVDASRSVHT